MFIELNIINENGKVVDQWMFNINYIVGYSNNTLCIGQAQSSEINGGITHYETIINVNETAEEITAKIKETKCS
jgi:hypothetical protein